MPRPVALVLAAGGTLAALALASPAQAQFRYTPSLRTQFLYTNNAELDPDEARVSDFITYITPAVTFDYRGPSVVIDGRLAVDTVIRAYEEGVDRAAPYADVGGEMEIVRDFLFLNARARASEIFYSPFGPLPEGAIAPTGNRYNAQWYRITPRIQGEMRNNIVYELRNDSIWTTQSSEPVEIRNTFTNRTVGRVESRTVPFGWGVDVDRTDYKLEGRDNQERMLGRVRAVWTAGPQFGVFVSGGYEDNRFPLSEQSGAIYGAGFRWEPSSRTSLAARWEHRFFGGSYDVAFDHRSARTVWSVRANRDITTYPETLAVVPSGTSVPGLLDDLLVSRVPDDDERAQMIAAFMEQRGLPLVLSEPLNLFNEQVYLQERAIATMGLLGARNSILVSLYRLRTQPIAGTGEALIALPNLQDDNTQLGVQTTWSYQLAPRTTATLLMDVRRTETNREGAFESNQQIAKLTLTHTLSPKTTLFGGARWQRFRTDIAPFADYDETAVFLGFVYAFR